MHGGEEAAFDADIILHYFQDWGNAVSSTRSIRDDMMFLFIVCMVIDAHDQSCSIGRTDFLRFTFARSRDKDFFGTGIKMSYCFVRVSESSGAFHHHVNFEFFPRQFSWIFFCQNLNFLFSYFKVTGTVTYFFWENTMHGIVFEKMSQCFIIS